LPNEEEAKDNERLEKINEIVGAYTEQAKQTADDYRIQNAYVPAETQIDDQPESKPKNFLEGDIGQFVNDLHQDIPEDVQAYLDKKSNEDQQTSVKSPGRHHQMKNITIDLFSAHQAELIGKQRIYKRQQASPKAKVHERLYANAQEKSVKQKLGEGSSKRQMKYTPKISQNSREIIKAMGRDNKEIEVNL
jgi:hypothetical protein